MRLKNTKNRTSISLLFSFKSSLLYIFLSFSLFRYTFISDSCVTSFTLSFSFHPLTSSSSPPTSYLHSSLPLHSRSTSPKSSSFPSPSLLYFPSHPHLPHLKTGQDKINHSPSSRDTLSRREEGMLQNAQMLQCCNPGMSNTKDLATRTKKLIPRGRSPVLAVQLFGADCT